MSNFIRYLPIIGIVLVVWVAFFNKFFFKGLIPLPSDITVGMYLPWINHNYGYPVRVPVKNALLTDTVSQFWIWRNWAVSQLKEGKISFWNPYSLAGYPVSPWFHTILFQPSNIFYFLFPQTTAIGLINSFPILILLFGTFLFIKNMKFTSVISLFGSISFTFSAFCLGWLTWGTVVWTIAFLPFILYFLDLILHRKFTVLNSLGFIISIIFSFLGGHPQTFFLIFIISIFYLILIPSFLLFKIKVALLFFLAILSTSFIALPSWYILQKSIRQEDQFIKNENFNFVSPVNILISLISPNFFGNPGTNNDWSPPPNYQEKLVWFGTISYIFCIYFLAEAFTVKLNSVKKYLLITFFMGLLLATRYPLGFIIYYFKIPLLSSAPAGRSLLLTTFSGVILSCFTFKDIVSRTQSTKTVRLTNILIISILAALFFSLAVSFFIYRFLNIPDNQIFLVNDYHHLRIAVRNLFIPTALSTISLLFLNFKSMSFLSSFLLLFCLVDGFLFGWKYTPFTRKEWLFPTTPIIDYLKEQYQNSSEFFRIEREKAEIIPPNMWQSYGFYSYSGYDPVYPLSYARYLKENYDFQNYSRFVEMGSPGFKPLPGIKYLFVIKRDKNGYISPDGSAPYWINNQIWEKVFDEKSVSLYKNSIYLPPYFLSKATDQNKIQLIKHQDSYWKFIVNTDLNNEFILLENNSSGWQAFIDGKSVSISDYQLTFKKIMVSKGSHLVEFKFTAPLFNEGILISIASLLLYLFLSYRYFVRPNIVN